MILIIDDDGAIRTSLTFKLNRIGYDAQAVATPKEAMAVVRSVAPELILMDMNLENVFKNIKKETENMVMFNQI